MWTEHCPPAHPPPTQFRHSFGTKGEVRALISATTRADPRLMRRTNARNPSMLGKVASAQIGSGGLQGVAKLAATQRGLVTRPQLLAIGVPDSTIDLWARTGRLHRIHRGVYAVGHGSLDLDARRLAAVLASGSGAAISHRSSGELQGFLWLDELTVHRAAIHLTRPGRSARRDGLIIHAARLGPADLTTHRGIPATTAARTLFDLAPSLTANALRRAFEEAEYLELLDRNRLSALCESGQGHRNVAELSRRTAAGTAVAVATGTTGATSISPAPAT
jgi:hypothetical protein